LDFKVNINEHVKVKLTDFGVSILKEQHDELNRHILSSGGKGLDEFTLRLDEDGYYTTQMWMLMSRFGHVASATSKAPFDTEIIVTRGEPI
jgi:hypothetical protein